MAEPEGSQLTVYPPAVWRRIARDERRDAPWDIAQFESDTRADIELRIELHDLANQIRGLLLLRERRLRALYRQHPEAPTLAVALILAGYTPEDAGMPPDFDGKLPEDLDQARTLLVWLQAHPSNLPPASEEAPKRRS
jgi:hypothetical protein